MTAEQKHTYLVKDLNPELIELFQKKTLYSIYVLTTAYIIGLVLFIVFLRKLYIVIRLWYYQYSVIFG